MVTPKLQDPAPAGQFERQEVACCLCRQSELEPLPSVGEQSFPLDIVICKNCGLVFQSPRWTAEGFQHYYSQLYDESARPDAVRASGDPYPEKSIVIRHRLEALDIRVQANGRILDVGCGMGWCLQHLATSWGLEASKTLFGIEPSPACQALLGPKGISLISCDMDTAWDPAFEGFFDLVVMRHVLEHSLDPVEWLRKVAHVLKPTGHVYVAVPDMLHFTRPLWGQWFIMPHTYDFSKKTLLRTAALAGLAPVHLNEDQPTAELWCVLQKGVAMTDVGSAYEEQRAALFEALRREISLDRYRQVIRTCLKPFRFILRNVIPRRLRDLGRKKLGYD